MCLRNRTTSKFYFVPLWLLVLFFGSVVSVQAAGRPGSRVVVLLAPGLRAEDLTRPELPALRRVIAEGASGWMVCRAARVTDRRLLRPDGRETTASLLLTLGSGSRAAAGPEVAALNLPESARAGANLQTAALRALAARNARLDHPVSLGALGDMLHQAGLKTAIIGNADAETPDRAGLLLAMDSAGRVDFPDDGPNRDQNDPAAPYGLRADVTAMAAASARLEDQTALLVLTFGDVSRADRYAPLCLPPAGGAHRAAALRSLNRLLSALLVDLTPQTRDSAAHTRTLLCILTPGPADSVSERQARFAPVVLWGDGILPGVLTSASTRWRGLALNTDFLATVADFWHLPLPSGATGRPMIRMPAPAAPTPESLRAAHDTLVRTARLQDALGGLPTVQMLLVLAGLAVLILGESRRIAVTLAFASVALPPGMLILPPVAPGTVWGASLLLAAFTLALAGWGGRIYGMAGGAERLFYGLCALLAILLCADLWTGSHLLRQAWMSYSAAEGARFYGIGNEFMGAAIGAACALIGGEPRVVNGTEEAVKAHTAGARLLPLLLLYALLLVAMGAGSFGAKVGAIPSAGIAFGIALLVWWRGRVRARDVVLIVAAAGLLLALSALLDLRHAAGQQSHFARAVSGAGGGSLVAIARRKLALEGYLLLHSPWSATLAVCAFGLAWLWRRFPQRFASRQARAALAGLIGGALASLLCNDSGVTAAALVLLYGWAWAVVGLPADADPTPALPFARGGRL